MLSQLIMTVKASVLLFLAAQAFGWMVKQEDARWIKGAPTIILIAMFAIGMFGQTVWVPYAALLAVLPLLARNRADAAALYIIAAVSVPAIQLNVNIGSIYLLSFDKWLMLALGLAIAFALKRPTGVVPDRPFDLPVILLLCLTVMGVHESVFTNALRKLVDPALTLALPVYLISRSLTRAEDVRRFTLAIAFASFAMACVAFVESRTGWLIYKQITSSLHLHSMLNGYMKQRAGMLRAPASFGESTSFGGFLAIGFMATVATRSSFKSMGKWMGALAIIVLGLLAANSRAAFIAVGVGLLAFDLYRHRYGALMGKLAAIVGLYGALVLAAPFSQRAAALVSKSADTASTSDYRATLLRRGMEEVWKHPYLGQAVSQALSNMEDLRQGEGIIDLVNGYVAYGLSGGVSGIILLLLVFVSLCIAMLLIRKKLAIDPTIEAAGGFVFAVTTFTISATFFSGFGGRTSTPFYAVMALGAALWAMKRTMANPTAAKITSPSLGDAMPGEQAVVSTKARAFGENRHASPVKIESPAGAAYRARQQRLSVRADGEFTAN